MSGAPVAVVLLLNTDTLRATVGEAGVPEADPVLWQDRAARPIEGRNPLSDTTDVTSDVSSIQAPE